MSVTLALVTCGPQLEVCLYGPSMKIPSVVRLGGVTPRSTLLLAAVDLLVEDAQIDRREISLVVVTRGPGSFTGIRSGLATASGLRAALGTRILACDSLPAQAMRVNSETEVWAAQPGRKGEVYAQSFRVRPGTIPGSAVVPCYCPLSQ